MAKIVEEVIVIKLSKIVKDGSANTESSIDSELLTTLETVAAELVGEGVVVEAVTE